MVLRRAAHRLVVSAVLLAAFRAWGASYLAPPGAKTVEFDDVTGSRVHGVVLDGSATFTIEGPAELLLSCYRDQPGKFSFSTRLEGAAPKARTLTARPTKMKKTPGTGALGATRLAVPAGEVPLQVDAPGCLLVVGGATEGSKSTTHVTTEEHILVVDPRGNPLPAPAPAPAAPQPEPPRIAPPPAPPSPLVRPPPAPAAAPPPTRTATPAPGPAPRAPAPVQVVAQPATTPPTGDRELGLGVSLRAGAIVPRTDLGTGLAIAGDLTYALPVLERRISLALGAGYALAPYQGTKLIPGRGYDPAFVQNTSFVPISLLARYRQELGASRVALFGGLGAELLVVSATFQSFSAPSSSQDTALGIAFEGGAEYPLGPGAVQADLRYVEARADFGTLGGVGQDGLGHFLLTAGYALHF